MIRLLMFIIFLLPVTNVFAQNVKPVIQRYAVIGTSGDGKRLALILTHFGPSSGAPFANLLVLEVGFSRPIFKDSAFEIQGDETTLALIASELFERNKQELRNLNIDFVSPKYSDANYIVESIVNPDSIQGRVDIESIGLKTFAVENRKSDSCSASDTETTIALEARKISIDPLNLGDCLNGPIQLRTVIRSSTALWFIVLRQTDFLGVPFYITEVAGISWQ